MDNYIIIAIFHILFLFLLLVGAFIVERRKSERPEPDYRAFFILGLTWLPLGMAIGNPMFWMIGTVFLAVGLANKGKWKERQSWSDLSSANRTTRFLLVFGLFALVATVAVGFIIGR